MRVLIFCYVIKKDYVNLNESGWVVKEAGYEETPFSVGVVLYCAHL